MIAGTTACRSLLTLVYQSTFGLLSFRFQRQWFLDQILHRGHCYRKLKDLLGNRFEDVDHQLKLKRSHAIHVQIELKFASKLS